jgi:hypothetical protein
MGVTEERAVPKIQITGKEGWSDKGNLEEDGLWDGGSRALFQFSFHLYETQVTPRPYSSEKLAGITDDFIPICYFKVSK